ncbi:unnamed protein product [Eruca vesicaria subsp. sativa]|uniref:PRA1 family protein n=1 Tax=Eruca vesicaria subsp. sativa TaxID=29727 RepID=A0ABC8J4L2_ERUVS|nr:unnamed protein product [Eruca vesicaria subsp. sativa]
MDELYQMQSGPQCNLYYYRTNYFLMLILVLGLALITRPLAIIGAALTALSLAFLNDSFAATFSEKAIRIIRQFSPHLSAKMRPPHIFVLWFTSCDFLWILYAFTTALLIIMLHASMQTPNLKARLNTFHEEFRAVWRNYSEL